MPSDGMADSATAAASSAPPPSQQPSAPPPPQQPSELSPRSSVLVPQQPDPPLAQDQYLKPPGSEDEKPPEDSQEASTGAQREAYQYWGYLFNDDKTGTDKLKSLLRGLKDVINEQYEPSDQPDLMPTQLAQFYRDMNGNYDQLFLGSPSETIAFIYKSLGCLYSLQPSHPGRVAAFAGPTVPALKTEGWILWQTIQLLLGPEQHSEFLRKAVRTWDVKDHVTGEVFPKLLPRECFPMEPDKRMNRWYEGVSDRLRREAEEAQRAKEIEIEHAEVRRLADRPSTDHRRLGDSPIDDDSSVDSRGSALAYFRNPVYPSVDGRPPSARSNSKRPSLTPRQTMITKGKEAATTFGNIVRSVGSPHLWDGRGGHSRSGSGGDGRRRSYDDRHQPAAIDAPPPERYDDRPSSHDRHHPSHDGDLRRHRSGQSDRPGGPDVVDDVGRDGEDPNLRRSPLARIGSNPSRSQYPNHRPADPTGDPRLRRTRSHEPTPTGNDEPFGGGSYFAGAADGTRPSENQPTDDLTLPAPTFNGVGPSFKPSGGPLFASHVARQPQQSRADNLPPPHPDPYGRNLGPDGGGRNQPPPPDRRGGGGRYPSRSPGRRPESRHRRRESEHHHHHHRHDRSPYSDEDDGNAPPGPPLGRRHHRGDSGRGGGGPRYPSPYDRDRRSSRDDDRGGGPRHDRRPSRDDDRDRDDRGPPPPPPPYPTRGDRRPSREDGRDDRGGPPRYASRDDRRDDDRDRDHDEDDAYPDEDRNRRRSRSRGKTARFADSGVGGRRYPSPPQGW